MHNLYFVLLGKDQANDSAEARSLAEDILNQNNFALEDSFFSLTKSDWFVIGGRWTGVLTKPFHGFFKKVADALFKAGVITVTDSIAQDILKEQKKFLQKLWKKEGGQFLNPLNRNHYFSKGYDDDAQILDGLSLTILKEYLHGEYENTEFFDAKNMEEFSFEDWLKISDKYLEEYWIVVIDYHN